MTAVFTLTAIVVVAPRVVPQNIPVRLTPIAHLRKGVDAWPHILHPKSEAERRINDHIAELNGRLAHELKECDAHFAEARQRGLPKAARNEEGSKFFDQAIKITMTGPTFLSLVADIDFYCGGVHPYGYTDVAIFDLQTGEPANPMLWFGPTLQAHLDEFESDDPLLEKSVSSSRLLSAYRELVKGEEYPDDQVFLVWPDAKSNTVMLQADRLPGCCEAEGIPVGLNMEKARELGFADSFLKAIEDAHQAGR